MVAELVVLSPDGRSTREVGQGARTGEIFARATWFARDLVNSPANDVHPTYLAKVASDLAKEKGLTVEVLDRAECQKLGMGAFLGVAAGSEQPPRFIHLTYAPARPRKKVAIIGKGITFDAGGLDLKSAEGMLRMKDDMSGAAAVLAVMRALPELKPAVEVHGLVAATENMPSGSAIRPGDVLKAMNGTTIEIGNTDAEGRLTAPVSSRSVRSSPDSSPTTRAWPRSSAPPPIRPASACGSCRSSTSTASSSRARSPTSTTWGRAGVAPSRPGSS